MKGPGAFETAVGLSGIWSEAPDRWSFSTLAEVSMCPRRYALRRASYPEISDRSGYPDQMTEAALLGTVVHEGVELVLRELCQGGAASLADGQSVEVIRRLGGYSKIAARFIDENLKKLASNPRMAPRLDSLRARLERRAPEMRRGMQALIAQSRTTAHSKMRRGKQGTGGPPKRAALEEGGHPEAELIADDIRFGGRVDLLVVHSDCADIIEFKTGQPSDSHRQQLHLYGLLWQLDEKANPQRLPVGTLTLGYLCGTEQVDPPADWEELRRWLQEEIAEADGQVRALPPVANPSVECWHCPVRQLCDEYWDSSFLPRDAESSFVDGEVTVVSRNGPTSWLGRLTRDGSEVLLRATPEGDALTPGNVVRLLNVLYGKGEDFDGPILTFTHNSEVFGPLQV